MSRVALQIPFSPPPAPPQDGGFRRSVDTSKTASFRRMVSSPQLSSQIHLPIRQEGGSDIPSERSSRDLSRSSYQEEEEEGEEDKEERGTHSRTSSSVSGRDMMKEFVRAAREDGMEGATPSQLRVADGSLRSGSVGPLTPTKTASPNRASSFASSPTLHHHHHHHHHKSSGGGRRSAESRENRKFGGRAALLERRIEDLTVEELQIYMEISQNFFSIQTNRRVTVDLECSNRALRDMWVSIINQICERNKMEEIARERMRQKATKEEAVQDVKETWLRSFLPKWDVLYPNNVQQMVSVWGECFPTTLRGFLWSLIFSYPSMRERDLAKKNRGGSFLSRLRRRGSARPSPSHASGHYVSPAQRAAVEAQLARGVTRRASLMRERKTKFDIELKWLEYATSMMADTVTNLGETVQGDLPPLFVEEAKYVFPDLQFFAVEGTDEKANLALLGYYLCKEGWTYREGSAHWMALLLLNCDVMESLAIGKSFTTYHFIAHLDESEKWRNLCFTIYLSKRAPAVAEIFCDLNITASSFLHKWMCSLFAGFFPVDLSCRIVDLYLLHGEIFLWWIALERLKMLQPELERVSKEKALDILDRRIAASEIDAAAFLQRVLSNSEDAHDLLVMTAQKVKALTPGFPSFDLYYTSIHKSGHAKKGKKEKK
mmetsp:Transcript_28512/g.72682  ORF Transcript_28512/g.72682 Transcript_28512/m.72682 type:complete len:659 (-) Transcript_28512:832-2808(-)